MALSILEKLGLLFLVIIVIYVLKYILSVIYTYIIGPVFNKVDFKSKGKWALVTGCTDGIGKEYAKELAARGCDIILVSRSLEKLKATAAELEKTYKVATKVIQADFTWESHLYEDIAKEIAGLEIGTLVNNVGLSYTYPEYFLEIPDWDKTTTDIIKTNVVSVTRMTAAVLPDMVKRGRGVIINIGSAASIIPSPMLTVYASTKAYVDRFSRCLNMEYTNKGIIVQCVMPGFVCSNMSGIRKSTLMTPTAETFVKSAISLVGTTTRTTGYFPHAIFANVFTFLENNANGFTRWLVLKVHETTRRKALRKYKKQ